MESHLIHSAQINTSGPPRPSRWPVPTATPEGAWRELWLARLRVPTFSNNDHVRLGWSVPRDRFERNTLRGLQLRPDLIRRLGQLAELGLELHLRSEPLRRPVMLGPGDAPSRPYRQEQQEQRARSRCCSDTSTGSCPPSCPGGASRRSRDLGGLPVRARHLVEPLESAFGLRELSIQQLRVTRRQLIASLAEQRPCLLQVRLSNRGQLRRRACRGAGEANRSTVGGRGTCVGGRLHLRRRRRRTGGHEHQQRKRASGGHARHRSESPTPASPDARVTVARAPGQKAPARAGRL